MVCWFRQLFLTHVLHVFLNIWDILQCQIFLTTVPKVILTFHAFKVLMKWKNTYKLRYSIAATMVQHYRKFNIFGKFANLIFLKGILISVKRIRNSCVWRYHWIIRWQITYSLQECYIHYAITLFMPSILIKGMFPLFLSTSEVYATSFAYPNLMNKHVSSFRNRTSCLKNWERFKSANIKSLIYY